MEKYENIKKEYDSLLEYLEKTCPGARDDFEKYYIACALRIWSGNELYSDSYGELLKVIQRGKVSDEKVHGETFSVRQIVTALGCCGEPERKLLVPGFYRAMVRSDLKTRSALSAGFIEQYSRLLASTALVNGDFTLEEARALSEITGGLAAYAKGSRVNTGAAPDYNGLITERLYDSYYRAPAPRKEEPVEGGRSAGTPEGEKPGSETINISFSIEPGWPGISPPPAESPAVREPEEESLESLLRELDGLVGLEGVKRDVHSLMNFIKIAKLRQSRGMKVPTISYHLVFTGNPGTGKTTVARLYYQMGLLPKGQFVETDRAALVAGYLGQTAIKTKKVIDQAMGGVLFIDEAYSLAADAEDSYGREAVETLLKAMEDHRDELVVIVAGYTELMHRFISSNPGLSSRFSKYFEFKDYSGAELLEIFRGFCAKNGYRLDERAALVLGAEFKRLFESRDEHFGNARTARNIFERAINAQADRVAQQPEIADADLELLCFEDVKAALGGDVS